MAVTLLGGAVGHSLERRALVERVGETGPYYRTLLG